MKEGETALAIKILGEISNKRGIMWEKIAQFQEQLNNIEGVLQHKSGEKQSKEFKKYLCQRAQ